MNRESILQNDVIVYQGAGHIKRGWFAVIMAAVLTIGTFAILPYADQLTAIPEPEYELRPLEIRREPPPPDPIAPTALPSPVPEQATPPPLPALAIQAPAPQRPTPLAPDLPVSISLDLDLPAIQTEVHFPTRTTTVPLAPPVALPQQAAPPAPVATPQHATHPPDHPSETLDADAVDQLPQAISKTPPVYPSRARWNNQEGYVDLQFVVTTAGQVVEATVIGSQPPQVFDKAALESLRSWRFSPGLKAGQPVSTRLRLRIRFTLD